MKVGEKIMKNNITTQKFFSDKLDPYKFNNIPWPRINQTEPSPSSTACLKNLPDLKRTTFLAEISASSPVLGFLPTRLDFART